MPVPADPKIYHIVHVDRLPSIIADGGLLCDAAIAERAPVGTTIGMNDIKQRRLSELRLSSHPDLYVGACVPFYFCPRSVMLYVISQANHLQLSYRGGQGPIVHLEADLRATVAWAEEQDLRWAFTLSNAGARYFEDRSDLGQLDDIDWDAVEATDWRRCKEGKQTFRSSSASRGNSSPVSASSPARQTEAVLEAAAHRPPVEIRRAWYY